MAIFSRNLAAHQVSTVDGTGEQTRDYVCVGDVARTHSPLKVIRPQERTTLGLP